MKILVVSYNPLPFPGGIWTFVSRLTDRLREAGHTVDILALNQQTLNYRIIGQPEAVTEEVFRNDIAARLSQEVPPLPPYSFMYNTESMCCLLEMTAAHYGLEQYDVIYAQDIISAGVLGKIRPPAVPVVTSLHGYLLGEIFYYLKSTGKYPSDDEIHHSAEYAYFNGLEEKGYALSQKIHVQSFWMRDILTTHSHVPTAKIALFSYGMDIDAFLSAATPQHSNDSSRKKIILYTGRLVYLKGISTLIEALGILSKVSTNWECWIVGDGERKNSLQEQCKILGIENLVVFPGVTSDIHSYLNKADIFVMPSLQDTQPHAVMEAQLSSLPVVVSDAAGLPEMVSQGNNGLVFPVENSSVLSSLLLSLLTDDEGRILMGQNAREWAKQKWSLDVMVSNFQTLFGEAVQSLQHE
ncbi:glycosyltransferase [Bacillus lacus]|uniref:Glycosyltransferase n=1 Tax=Metabacillus lacus TaxID=1983721 RepID=A0A7X2LXZ4_9BACI|nr:glycosyltransferase family 4 protein [Metabacillus lacus]MRX73070.1 glycosyltransferase [Metabacillus lacus]